MIDAAQKRGRRTLLIVAAVFVVPLLLAWAWFGTPRIPAEQPIRVWLVLLSWAVLLAVLTPICAAWGRLKQRRRDLWWLAYL